MSCFQDFRYLVFKERFCPQNGLNLNENNSFKTKQKPKRVCPEGLNVLKGLLRKEVIQPHLPIRLPCYDFTPIICPTFGGWFQKVTSPTSGVTNSRGVTGGVYKARERIHRGMLIRDY
jgi:hypothetical protein